MSSRIEQATVALVALLASGVPAAIVTRNHDVPAHFESSSDPILNVVDGAISPDFHDPQLVDNHVNLILEGYVTANDHDDLGPALDELLTPTWAVVLGNPSLGSDLTWDVQIGGDIERELDSANGKPTQSFRMPVVMRVVTTHNDLTT